MNTAQMESQCNTNMQKLVDQCKSNEAAFHRECCLVAVQLISEGRLLAAQAVATMAQYCIYRCRLIANEQRLDDESKPQ